MLYASNLGGGAANSVSAPKCQQDYKTRIERVNERIRKNQELRFAIYSYLDDRVAYGKMTELIGELVDEERELEKQLEYLKQLQALE